MASNFLERCPSVAKGGPRNNSSHFPTMQVSLIINNQRIHTSAAERMRQSIKLRNYNIYFGKNHGSSKATLVDWDNLAKAYKNQTYTDKIFLTKYLHGWLPRKWNFPQCVEIGKQMNILSSVRVHSIGSTSQRQEYQQCTPECSKFRWENAFHLHKPHNISKHWEFLKSISTTDLQNQRKEGF